ncbi:delta(3,5)-Delta(2,4)-dienoyl-CoA isomerase, mitochondrial-like isoform X2 [Lutzomyia longipalpis]|uniref:Putative enoyl-coa isomerase n=1 Tax=Lutzomyia longipalpis TaxID=7200 RepID=A0A1B0CIE7_LUTLO|nr:delta(3,5)-Delta(2,4)-dienoyl-CoA isomerase, mitochondrial-like isoform X2 [Lutzomyia longipalpis]
MEYKHLRVNSERPFVFRLDLDNEVANNTMTDSLYHSIYKCITALGRNNECRAIVISSLGKDFCTGIDLDNLGQFNTDLASIEDISRRGRSVESRISTIQRAFVAIERCKKPVIAIIHGACVGPGMGLITACDMRYCSTDAWFQVKDVELGMAADSGTLQRLPKVVGNTSFAREMCFTARRVDAEEALRFGLVNRIFESRQQMLNYAIDKAELIAHLSPVAIQTTKTSILYSQGHTIQEGLDHIRDRNALARQSEDFHISMGPAMTGSERPAYARY